MSLACYEAKYETYTHKQKLTSRSRTQNSYNAASSIQLISVSCETFQKKDEKNER